MKLCSAIVLNISEKIQWMITVRPTISAAIVPNDLPLAGAGTSVGAAAKVLMEYLTAS